MNKEVLFNKSEKELRGFFNKEFELILVRILSLLNITISFPIMIEELILDIPVELYNEQCTRALYIINSPDIKTHLDELIVIYENLLKYEKSLSSKR